MDKIFKVEKDFQNTRLDKWFKRNVLDLPHSLISKLVRIKKIKVNNLKTTTSYKLQKGDLVKFFSYNKYRSIKKEKKITYKTTKFDKKRYDQFVVEDNENFLVLNKPSGVPVQGGTKSFKNIVDILKSTKYFKNSKPYIVHRIDKDTSDYEKINPCGLDNKNITSIQEIKKKKLKVNEKEILEIFSKNLKLL